MFAGISDPYLTIYISNSASQFAVEKINKNFIDLHNWGKVAIFLLTKCFNMYYEQKQSPRRVLWKGVLRNFAKFTGKHLCQSIFFNKVAGACNFIKKETLAQVFSCEFCEISKNTFFYRTPLVAAFLWGITKQQFVWFQC